MMKWVSIFSILLLAIGAACSSAPSVRMQKYAILSNERTFEYEFSTVWRAVEATVKSWKITSKDRDSSNNRSGSLETDWIYSQSRDKYIEFLVNGTPRKKYLQTRIKYKLNAKQILGGTEVIVYTNEEIERLSEDGFPLGYERSEQVDPSRAHELLEKIHVSLLAAP